MVTFQNKSFMISCNLCKNNNIFTFKYMKYKVYNKTFKKKRNYYYHTCIPFYKNRKYN